MKHLFSGRMHNAATLLAAVMLTACLATSCKKEAHEHEDTPDEAANKAMATQQGFENTHRSLDWRTILELWAARLATTRYQNLQNAINDGYKNIDVIVPNMGHHYRKLSLVDGTFDVFRPELLVYNKKQNGTFELVAVEYAIPIASTPNQAPEGFTGSADVWDRNTTFNLWLLHAWVWKFNPAGVFNPTNPLVHTH
jgi:hypothetical protein